MSDKTGTASRGRVRRFLLPLTCVLFVVLPPTIALAATQFTYAQGSFGSGGIFHTTGQDQRNYNQCFHQKGKEWYVYYVHGTDVNGFVDNTDNPTQWPEAIGYAYSYSKNINDDSGVTWTCETTRPS
jgi:hypothetical protein